MKKLQFILPLLLFLISCSERDVDAEQLQLRDGVYYALDEEVPYSGRITEHHPNGQLSSEMTVVNGLPDGLAQRWYENGQLMGKLAFVHGKPEGLNHWWHENGQLMLESTYNNGKGVGVYRKWHEDGRLEAELCVKDEILTDCNE